MEQQFIQKEFRSGSLKIIRHANRICSEYRAEGYDLSLRQLYYQFVANNLIENKEKEYKRFGNIISDARLAGLLDWDYIKDRGREHVRPSHWATPAGILKSAAHQFRVDRWEGQENFIIVMVEKQALEGILLPLCKRLDVGFIANKGYSSSSMMYEIGQMIAEMRDDYGKEIHVLYLGDHDSSGMDMSRDVEDRLEMFSDGPIETHRLALNMDQIEEFKPPENPAKLSDSRAEDYILKYGTSSWELDALEPRILIRLVEDAVTSRCDMMKFNIQID